MLNLDYISAMLARKVQVRGIFDSAMWLDMNAFPSSKLTSLAEQTQKVLGFVMAHDHLGDKCVWKYLGSQRWKCLMGQYQEPLTTRPFSLSESQV